MTQVNGHTYKFLEPRPGSNFRQLFYKGRGLFAQTLFRETVGLEPRTLEVVAKDFDVPVEAVLEAIHYCTQNEDLLRQEREATDRRIKEKGLDRPPYSPPGRELP
jgi:hypothetical protein